MPKGNGKGNSKWENSTVVAVKNTTADTKGDDKKGGNKKKKGGRKKGGKKAAKPVGTPATADCNSWYQMEEY